MGALFAKSKTAAGIKVQPAHWREYLSLPSIWGVAGVHGAPLTIFGVSLFFLLSIILEKGYFLLREDSLFESLTAVFYLAGALLCLKGSLRGSQQGSSIARAWLLGWCALFLFLAMEEVSWGQRIFGVGTPGFFDANKQDEINLHNFSLDLNRVFYFLVFLIGVGLPSLTTLSGSFASFVARRSIPLPPLTLVVPFALASAFLEPGRVSTGPEMLALPVAVSLWFAFVLAAKIRRKDRRFAEWKTLHLVMGLSGVLLIQLVLTFFEGNLGHESHPSEIKEFLFSICFLIFAYWLSRRKRPLPLGAHPGEKSNRLSASPDVR